MNALQTALERYLAAWSAWAPHRNTRPASYEGQAIEQLRALYAAHRDAREDLRRTMYAEIEAGRLVRATLADGRTISIGAMGFVTNDTEQWYSPRKGAQTATGAFWLPDLKTLESI